MILILQNTASGLPRSDSLTLQWLVSYSVGAIAGPGQSMVANLLEGLYNPVGGNESSTLRRIFVRAQHRRR